MFTIIFTITKPTQPCSLQLPPFYKISIHTKHSFNLVYNINKLHHKRIQQLTVIQLYLTQHVRSYTFTSTTDVTPQNILFFENFLRYAYIYYYQLKQYYLFIAFNLLQLFCAFMCDKQLENTSNKYITNMTLIIRASIIQRYIGQYIQFIQSIKIKSLFIGRYYVQCQYGCPNLQLWHLTEICSSIKCNPQTLLDKYHSNLIK
eukprot:TRINITY_DN1641_c2_g1_i1.p1 TRINITY_DN1641_c2_g1~~TRINITY_DN1641_c2_g1_i1.p1  ORF type:complete len:203 (+),score=-22.02 TRINITY_DN1641_c2_g1_i1:129-737(+)